MRYADPGAVKPLLTDGAEIACLDVREHGQYGEGHPFFAVNLPYSRLEILAPTLLPCRKVRCVLLDDGDGVAEKAAGRLAALGYGDLTVMRGGAPAWAAAGFTLFKGVNLPSKTFGELVEHAMSTPSISANELKVAQESGADLIVLDGRTPEEYFAMSLPGARSCPNAELGYRIGALDLGSATRIVVNCAGRTRSIIGAQTLRNLGVQNEVVALRNGTQGWALAGFDLSHRCEPAPLPELSASELEASRNDARRLIGSAGIAVIDMDDLIGQRVDFGHTNYLFDVRTSAEYAAGHLPGAIHAPGGQLVQAADQWIAVRNARVVLCDDTGLRAPTTALWLRGMGHQVAILDADASLGKETGLANQSAAEVAMIAPADVAARLAAGAILIDLSPSMAFRAAHISGALWSIRPRLSAFDLAQASEILLVAPDPHIAAATALEFTGISVSMISGGPDDWRVAGLDIVASPDVPTDADCIDYLFFVHDRHRGNLAAAQAYLDWETGLVGQLDTQERAALRPELSVPNAVQTIGKESIS
jgi:rhodanese-related sulfurtransferase